MEQFLEEINNDEAVIMGCGGHCSYVVGVYIQMPF